ncbi:DUF1499 domain-containing protein [Chroococcus sp. FPU101]|uniref:DUF1499 domain-containing protein n=1 Tax=Chroococcus sp. FPU101 TaxID=1974212 RepID=UPI001A8EB477|nr:DUF1499 domain-containing protein [Chroococcus sp. FPU101]GFE67563.1 hypothetical protein CFPU101_01730 [Chroococcus sp. FPU101]
MSQAKSSSFKSKNRGVFFLIAPVLIILITMGIRVAFPTLPTPFSGMRPDNLGVVAGRLAPCPSSPNCVSSQSLDKEHYIEPIAYQGESQTAIAALTSLINSQERTKIIAEESNYLYAEFASRWMGYVDDVEFLVNSNEKVIDVRSASRLGESDLGVNRQRIEQIRKLF